MVDGVAREVGDSSCKTVAHTNQAELGDGVLLEELGDEACRIAESEEVACWPKVFFGHGEGEIENKDDMAYDASLKGCSIS